MDWHAAIDLGHLSLRVSRPYFWLVTLWIYLLPTGGRYDIFTSTSFWLGAAYCTLPLNLLCYLMNDIADVEVDKYSLRKSNGSMLGTKEGVSRLRMLVPVAVLLQLPFLLFFGVRCGAIILPWFCGVLLVNWLYNSGPRLSGNYPPLDLVCPCGYMLVIPLSCWLNNAPYPPARSWAHVVFLVLRTQLWIQTFDRDSDAAAGRRTTAVVLGLRGSHLLLGAMLAAESAFAFAYFAHSWPLKSFSASSLALLVAQVCLTTPGRAAPISPSTIARTFVVLGLGGLGLMLRVWVDAAFE